MSNKLDLYTINNQYGNFYMVEMLNHQMYLEEKQRRPFIGVVIMVNNKNYIVPLTSPKQNI